MSLKIHALEWLDISAYLPTATGLATQHFFAQQNNFLASGNQVRAASDSAFTTTITCRMFVDDVDVRASRRFAGTVVTLGDSITDGYRSTTNANRRYPDDLARRLNAVRGRTLSVSNAGIGGNDLLTFRTDVPFGSIFGPPAVARLSRDVADRRFAPDAIDQYVEWFRQLSL